MKKPFPIGIDNYKDMLDRDYYYVDKTLMIKDIIDKGGKVSLFTRPRRFGKTLALSMLKTYFEKEYTRAGELIDNSHYFAGMKILGTGEKYIREMGQYPVISLSLKSAKQPDFKMARASLIGEITIEYDRHRYVLLDNSLSESEKQKYNAVLEGKAEDIDYAKSLQYLSMCLEKYHHKKTIILIDEYDVPLENSYFEKFYDKMIKFIRSLFESSLKTNDSLEFAVITGCLRISKESIFTGLNNLKIVSILNDNYSEWFGFVQSEIDEMLAYYELEEKREEAKSWYDGYLFGNTEVYNPWSIINYVETEQSNSKAFPRPYWSNTSSNSIIRELVEQADTNTRTEIEKLIAGGTIEKAVHEEITYDDIHETQDNLWNFLFFTGYLKAVSQRFEDRQIYLTMRIPNEEVLYIYENTILTWFDKKLKKTDFTKFAEAIDQCDATAFGDFVTEQLMDTISFFDYAENYYHGFLAGLLKALGTYKIESNRESGTGRPDIVMEEFKFRGKSAVLEIKVTDDITQMDIKCDEAIEQIEKMDYDHELLKDGFQPPLKIGVCFFKKGCVAKMKK